MYECIYDAIKYVKIILNNSNTKWFIKHFINQISTKHSISDFKQILNEMFAILYDSNFRTFIPQIIEYANVPNIIKVFFLTKYNEHDYLIKIMTNKHKSVSNLLNCAIHHKYITIHPINNINNDTLWSALYVAYMNNNLAIAELLLKYGGHINECRVDNYENLFQKSVVENKINFTKMFINYGANIDLTEYMFTQYGWPLIYSANHNNTEMAALLLKSGCDPNTTGINSETSLIIAAQGNNYKLLDILLEVNDLTVAKMDCYHKSAIDHLIKNHNTKYVVKLLKYVENQYDHNIQIQRYFKSRLWHYIDCSVYYNQYDITLKLLKFGKQMKIPNNAMVFNAHQLLTSVIFYATTNKKCLVKSILEIEGININKRNKYGINPIIAAFIMNDEEIGHMLFNHGSNPKILWTTQCELKPSKMLIKLCAPYILLDKSSSFFVFFCKSSLFDKNLFFLILKYI